jgi:hypothetical protein
MLLVEERKAMTGLFFSILYTLAFLRKILSYPQILSPFEKININNIK